MIEQGSDEWKALRVGKATASRIADIMRKGKGGSVSLTRARYMGELVAERLTGVPADSYKSADMQWGNDTEAQAREFYAICTGYTLAPVDFVDHPMIDMSGASPDRLVGDSGLLEIKCPATHTHIETLLGASIDPDYVTQMQWQMACTGRIWCDFVSYDPRLPDDLRISIARVERDNARIGELEEAVRKFLSEVDAKVSALNGLRKAA